MRGRPYEPPNTYAHVDPERAARIADEFAKMEHAPNDPKVAAAYKAMADETLAQYQKIKESGLKVEFIPKDGANPYPNPRDMTEDVRKNNHMWVFSTRDGFGSNDNFDPSVHPLLADTGEKISGKPALANDIFRVVHDYFGHVKEGVGFRADGEENAWRAHSAMYSPEARAAMTSETRGQNSWLNYGPHGDKNRTAKSEDTIYADQKAGLMPDWVTHEGATDNAPFYSREESGKPHITFKNGERVVTRPPSSTKNAVREQERAQRGKGPVQLDQKYDRDTTLARARAEYDPDQARSLSAEVAAGGRATSPHDEATVLLHGINLRNRADAVEEQIAKARKEGNLNGEVNAKLTLDDLHSQMDENDVAARVMGNNWHGTGDVRQQLVNHDMSLTTRVRRLEAIGPVSPQMKQRAAVLSQRAKKAQAIVDGTKPKPQKALKDLAAQFNQLFKKPVGGPLYARVADPRAASVLRKMAKALTDSGVTDPDEVLSQIHELVKDSGVSKGDISDTISRTAPKKTIGELRQRYNDLNNELKDLNKVQDTLTGRAQPAPREIAQARRLTNEIAELQRQIDYGEDAARAGPEQGPDTAHIAAMKEQLAAKQQELDNTRPSPPATRPVDPMEAKNRTRQAAIAKEMAEIKSKIQRKDYEEGPARTPPKYNEATWKAQRELDRVRGEYDALEQQHRRSQQNIVAKIADLWHNYHMFDLLTSWRVFKKLGYAVAFQHAVSHLNDMWGSAWKHVPGLSQIYKQAPMHGQGWQYGAKKEMYTKGIPAAFRGAGQQWLYGKSDIENAWSNKHLSAEFTDFAQSWGNAMSAPGMDKLFEGFRVLSGYPGRTHAMVKEFIAQPTFYESLWKRQNFLKNQLKEKGWSEPEIQEHMQKESTVAMLSMKAMADALESKMQGKNAIADSINRFLVDMERTGGLPGQLASFGLKSIQPIRKVPMNIAKDFLSYAPLGGFIKAGTNIAVHGLKDMTEERADYIAKNINKGSTGLVPLLAIGFLGGPAMFGGVPGAERKKKGDELQPNDALIFESHLGTEAFHGGPAMIIQLGAQFRKIWDKDYGDSEKSIDEGLAAFGSQIGRTVPYSDTVRRTYETLKYGEREGRGWDQVAGNQLRSMLIPQLAQQYAEEQDEYKGWRHPRNWKEDILTGAPQISEDIPSRQDVPAHAQKRSRYER